MRGSIKKLSSIPCPKITREQLWAYAGASGDRNPIHLDDDVAKKAGFPSVIAHGMLSMGLLGSYIQSQFPENQYLLQSFRARFKRVIFPGDTLTCEGEIRKETETTLSVALWCRNQVGEIMTEGEAVLMPLDPNRCP